MEQPLKKIHDVEDLKGKYVFLRASMNVPIVDGVVENKFRITRGLVTLKYLVDKGARVIIAGHIQMGDETPSAEPVSVLFGEYLPNVQFCPEVVGDTATQMRNALNDGGVLVLENLRRDPREKKNDPEFARALAELADLYVNDAFAASHRDHASLSAITAFLPSYVGMNFIHEYEELMKAITPQSPSLFILGGAKFDTKIPLVTKFLDIYDHIFIGGALANDIFKARGFEVGTSLVADVDLSSDPIVHHPKLLVPTDVTVSDGETTHITTPDAVAPTENILDAGPATMEMLAPLVKQAASILWNGPLGNYEQGFDTYTLELAKLIAGATAYSVVGGGDTVASIAGLGQEDHFAFLSTAGGAMLTLLETGTLAAIDAQYRAPNYQE